MKPRQRRRRLFSLPSGDRRLLRFVIGDGLAIFALMFGRIAVPWWIVTAGGARDLVWYGTFMGAGSLILLPLAAPLGDRFSKRRLIAVALLMVALEESTLAVVSCAKLYSLPLALAIEAVPLVAMALLVPAMSSAVAEMIASDQVSRAMAMQKTAQSIGRLCGPIVAGAALAGIGVTGTFTAGAASALLTCLLISGAMTDQSPTKEPRSVGGWVHEVTAGFVAKWRIPLERGWTAMNFFSVMFTGPAVGLLVPLKLLALKLNGSLLGACEGALAMGQLIASLGGSGWLVGRLGRFRVRIASALVQAVAVMLIGIVSQPFVLPLLFILLGFSATTIQLVGQSHRLLATPREFRMRMAAANLSVTQAAASLGPALIGLLLTRMSVDGIYLLFGCGVLIVAFGFTRVPGLGGFLTLEPVELEGWYGKEYPRAFGTPPPSGARQFDP